MTKQSTSVALVEQRGQQAVTTSDAIALGCKVQHKNVLSLIRRYKNEFEEFGLVAFETRPRPAGQHGGGDVEVVILNEDQATYLITLLRNNDIVRAFKRTLVKEFRKALNAINQRFSNPPRRELLTDKRRSGSLMCETLKDWRDEAGKATETRHYTTEHRLCNWALTGAFRPLDEKSLGNDDLELLRRIRVHNTALIDAEIPYAERKSRLSAYAIRQRTKLLPVST